jgi:hypothetical protein
LPAPRRPFIAPYPYLLAVAASPSPEAARVVDGDTLELSDGELIEIP